MREDMGNDGLRVFSWERVEGGNGRGLGDMQVLFWDLL